MHINGRINKLEREANAKAHKHIGIEIYIADWCCDNGNCNTCKNRPKLKSKEYVNGVLVINVCADRYVY